MRLPTRDYVDRMLNKSYSEHNTSFYFLPFQDTRPSNLYKERIGKLYGDPIACLGYLEINPTDLRLQELGWSKEPPELIIRVPFSILLDINMGNIDGTVNFSTDDRIKVYEKEYQLAKFTLREPFIDNRATFVWIGGRNFTNGR